MKTLAPWSSLRRSWIHIQLPGFRSGPAYQTYESSPFDELPPIPIQLDEDCNWLMKYGTVRAEAGLHRYERNLHPEDVVPLAQQANLPLPASFIRFMTSAELQSRLRSCTDCYLDPGERIVETTGALSGRLIHFLSDFQYCAHWYLHLLPDGSHAVLTSQDPYCYLAETSEWIENPACRLERINLDGLDFAYCARSFSEFLYRFWIENEIWYALTEKSMPLSLQPLELEYVRHYSSDTRAQADSLGE